MGEWQGDIRWQAVFFVGPAGSGKTWIRNLRYVRHLDFKVIDPDAIKKMHPNYDPEKPFEVHTWSKQIANAEFSKVVTNGNGDSVVVDGTGRDISGIVRQMDEAARNGYKTYVVYVYVPFEISIYRNRNRERFVPESMIMEQSDKIEKNFIILKSKAYKSKVIPNFESEELMRAKRDIEEYSVPQVKRPPRPGDQGYGLAMAASMRVSRIARRMIGMTEDEAEDWRDDILTMVSRLDDMVSEIEEGDFSDLDEVKRCGIEIEREQINLDDMVLSREADVLLREVAKVLNEAEGVRRWWEDESRKFRNRCEMISKEVKVLAEKFKRLEGRV